MRLPPNRPLTVGTWFLVLFSVCTVTARGIRWDENYEFAQVMLRQVVLPDGHPLTGYVLNIFSLQTHMTAWMLSVLRSAAVVCAFRNLLFMLATVVPVFLLTHLLLDEGRKDGRAVLASLAAVALTLFGIHIEFDATYPQFIWPDIFSNGHVGLAWALLTVFLLLAGRRNAGCLMLGLMPCIHIGNVPPVALLCGLWLARAWRRQGLRSLAKPMAMLTAGVAVCALFRIATIPAAGVSPLPAYAATGDAVAIWKGFVANHDIHRAIPRGNTWLALAGALLLTGAVWQTRRNDRWLGLLAYAACIAAIVLPTVAVHVAMGIETPPLLLRWMPYRLLNHLPILLIAATIAVLAQTAAGRSLLLAALLYCLLYPVMQSIMDAELAARYLAPNVALLFFLYGAALANPGPHGADLVFPWRGVPVLRRGVYLLLPLLLFLLVLPFHRFGACCLLAGFLASRAAHQLPAATWRLAAPTLAACALLLLHQQATAHASLPRTDFAQRVVEYLSAQNQPDAVLLAPPEQILLQAQTQHPVMGDMALPYMITYVPKIGPVVEQIFNDVHGISFLAKPEPPLSGDIHAWRDWWRQMSPERWRALAAKYGFHYVAAPRDVKPNLPAVVESKDEALYKAL